MSYLLAIGGLAVLIVIHELGHMMVARWSGMRVDKFSIFFGPPLLKWRGKETTYQLAVIPVGGYVQIAGMNPHEQLPPDDPGSYQNKSALARFATVFAGPAVNYLFAILLMVVVMLAWGIPRWQLTVDKVEPKAPAATAGMRSGDLIEAIGGHPVTGVEEVLAAIGGSSGQPLEVKLKRAGQPVSLKVTPMKDGGGYRIGIGFGRKLSFGSVGAGNGVLLALYYPFAESKKILAGLGRLVTGKVSAKQVGGPLEIVRQLKMSFEDSFAMALIFLAMLNVYLGLFNLLPLPALDGGRLVFLAYTILFRRPVNQRFENAVHTAGFLLLLGLMVLVTYRDIARIFQ